MKVKTFLPQLMAERGLTQKEIAEGTGLSQTTIGKVYRGHFDSLSNHTVESLCKFFKLRSINQLIDIEWEPQDFQGGTSHD